MEILNESVRNITDFHKFSENQSCFLLILSENRLILADLARIST